MFTWSSLSRAQRFWLVCGSIAVVLVVVALASTLPNFNAGGAASWEPTSTRYVAPTRAVVQAAAPACTAAEQDYLNTIAAGARELTGHLRNLATLNEQIALAPDLVLDGQWQREVAASLQGLEQVANAMSSTTAPPSATAIKNDLLLMSATTAEFVGLYQEAVTQIDPGLLNAAMDAMIDVNRHIQAATRKADRLCG